MKDLLCIYLVPCGMFDLYHYLGRVRRNDFRQWLICGGAAHFFHYGISPHCAKNSWGRRLSPKVKAMHGKGSCWDEQRLATTGFWTVSVGQFYPLLPPPQLALSASSSKTYTLLHVGNYSTNSFTDHKFSNKQVKVWNIRDGTMNRILLFVTSLQFTKLRFKIKQH